jgi:hypothetical protein
MKSLSSCPWGVLFQRALRLVDDIQRHGGSRIRCRTFGGGTVLMFCYRHRHSKDFDIFVPDPQQLGWVTPRLSLNWFKPRGRKATGTPIRTLGLWRAS